MYTSAARPPRLASEAASPYLLYLPKAFSFCHTQQASSITSITWPEAVRPFIHLSVGQWVCLAIVTNHGFLQGTALCSDAVHWHWLCPAVVTPRLSCTDDDDGLGCPEYRCDRCLPCGWTDCWLRQGRADEHFQSLGRFFTGRLHCWGMFT